MKNFIYKKLSRRILTITILLFFSLSTFAGEMTLNDQEMQKLARDFRLDIQQSPGILHAPLANDYIQHLGTKLASHAEDMNIHYAFFIYDSDEVNAFAGPGGTIVVNSALILATDQEDELAAVLAHEIAHSEQKHWLKDLNRQSKIRIPMIASSLAAIALGLINPALGSGALMGSLSGYAQNEINHTRSHEKEADRIGIQLLYAAGYNPEGMVSFFKKLQKYDQYHDLGSIPPILLTHPLDEIRIADAQDRIEQLPKKHYIANNDYFLFKEIIRVMTAKKPAMLLPYYQHQRVKHPNDTALRYGYALTLMKVLQFEKAEPEFRALIKQSPHNYYYLLALSGCELGMKKTQQGLTDLHTLYNNYPDNLSIILDYSTALIQFNQYQKAETVLHEGLEEYPNSIVLLQNLAQAQARSHQTARAYLTRAKIFMQLGQLREAGIALRNAKKSVLHDPLLMAQIKAELRTLDALQKQQD